MLPHEIELRMSFYEAVSRDSPSVSSAASLSRCSSYSFNNGLTTYYYNGDKESYTDAHGRVWTKIATEYLPYPDQDKTLRSLELANQLDAFMLMREFEGILHVPLIYRKLFYRTRQYTTSVQCLIDATIAYTPSRWAEAACLLVDWSIDILRHPAIGFERFLHSQRESIYWILDDTLLKACLDQWDMPSSNTSWDKVTLPLRNALARAESKLPEWAAAEYAELQKWGSYGEVARDTESGYFRRSRNFLRHSNRIHELWRTMKLCAKGQLPAELARVVVEHVSEYEKLPLGELRPLYLPRDKGKKLPATDYRGYGPDPFGETADIMIERIRGFTL